MTMIRTRFPLTPGSLGFESVASDLLNQREGPTVECSSLQPQGQGVSTSATCPTAGEPAAAACPRAGGLGASSRSATSPTRGGGAVLLVPAADGRGVREGATTPHPATKGANSVGRA